LSKTIDPKVEAFLKKRPIFCQPWWLEAVSPGQWDYVVAYRGEEVAAVLPYTYKIRLGRYRLIEMPPLTPYLGVYLRDQHGKYANRLGEEKDLMTELIDQLPSFAAFDQGFHPNVTNWLPFHWKDYKQTTHYTYIINDTKDMNALWNETRENIRTDIKKAQKQLTVSYNLDFNRFLTIQRMTFERQSKNLPYREDVYLRIEEACKREGVRKMLYAMDDQECLHAAVYLIWDADTVYYLMGGSNPALRNSGANSLLVWKAIEFASESGKRFDFEGSMVESIERFVRAFGARQVPYFRISKMNSPVVRLYRALYKLTHNQTNHG
jgi:lipid II:glycine glycyltransferase (peptidoglycan interpeptide bridge formation enzyme)